jgi:aspartyl-tRNA(Asn)/glutamyl-tRNA(Gln) amidotransferase subunit A
VRPVNGGPPQMNGEWGLLSAFEIGASVTALRPAHDAEFGRNLMETLRYVDSMSQTLWATMMEKRAGIVEWCASVFAECDVLVTPTVPYDPPPARGPFPAETEGRPQITAAAGSFTIPFNLSWHPAATVRVGLSRVGLPIGLHIVGPHHRDDLVLQVARAFERERPAHPSWPMRGRS